MTFSLHSLQSHLNSVGFPCDNDIIMQCKWKGCDYYSSSLKDVCDHVSVHKSYSPFMCEWEGCGMMCTKRARLSAHLLTHIPYKGFKCKICQKAFRRQQEMKRHFVSLHMSDKILVHDISSMNTNPEEERVMSISSILN